MSNKLVDLSALGEFKTQSDLKYQDKLTAGTGISIDANNVISATGGGGGSVAWTLHDSKTGKTDISLPSSFNEILIHCKAGGQNMSAIIPYQALSSTISYWSAVSIIGASAANTVFQAGYRVTLSTVRLERAGSSTDFSSTAVTSIYYR